MQPISSKAYAISVKRPDEEKSDGKLIGFGRIFCGRLRKGDKVFVFGATHTEEHPDVTQVIINDIFIFKGANSIK